MKTSKDLISIIVPCYNVEKFIERCFKSITSQTYNNIEVLFVDDGSKDETSKILKELIEKDKRCKYYYKKNGGLSSARNYGMRFIKGKYVCFVDSDDYISIDYIEKLYKSIVINKSSISICGIERIYDDHTSVNNIDELTVEMCRFPAAWNKMYLSSLFKKYNVEFPEGKWYEDLATTPKLVLMEKYSIVDEPLYKYVQNKSSIMHTYDDRIYQIYDVVEDIEQFCKNNNEYDNKYSNLEFINIYHILIGTIFRISFKSDFKIKDIKIIYEYVKNKYPKWFKNYYIKRIGLFYKVYLLSLKLHFYGLIYIMLKIFGKRVNL